MLVDLTPAQVLALANIVADLVERHVDVEPLAEKKLLQLLVDVRAERRLWPEEHDRQLLLLALAICALDTPNFDDALRNIASQVRGGPGEQDGTPMYEVFKRFNRDRWQTSPPRPK